MKLHDILRNSAGAFPDHDAVVHLERKISYRELFDAVEKIGLRLERLPFALGTRVGILFENSIEYVIAFFAVFRAGHVAVPIDTSLHPEKINFILADCGAEILLMQTRYERHLPQILGDNSPLKWIISDKPLRHAHVGLQMDSFDNTPPTPPRRPGTPNQSQPIIYDLKKESADAPHELAAIFYTSGSTGAAKGVMLSHRNLISNTIGTVEYLKLGPDDRIMVILPFYYIYGNSLLLTHILVGGTLVIDNRFLYPELVLDTMEKERVTGFSGVPSNFMILLNNSTLSTRRMASLRYFTQAGGAMAPEVIRRLMNTFPTKEIYIMYGQTEAAPRVSWCPPERLKDKLGTIGIPVPGVTIRVVDDDGNELPVGADGELAVSGDNVMLGYWNQPDEQQQVLRHGWLFTGDLARMDEDGFFYIVGRKKEIIKAGGNRVSAKEVEECLLENENISEATVFGVKDDILVEAIKAVIVLKEGKSMDQKGIQNFCRARLADYKIPKYIDFVDALPKYQSGKVNKLLLMGKAH